MTPLERWPYKVFVRKLDKYKDPQATVYGLSMEISYEVGDCIRPPRFGGTECVVVGCRKRTWKDVQECKPYNPGNRKPAVIKKVDAEEYYETN